MIFHSTIRFQKVVQFAQVLHLQLTDALEFLDYLCHQLVLGKVSLQH